MLANVQSELDKFRKRVISRSKANLTKGKRNSSRALYDSLDSKLKVSKNSFSLAFLMEEYGQFQDQGVKGSKSTYSESSKSPFKYTDKVPSSKHFTEWVKRKGLVWRNKENGRIMGYKTISAIIARSIFNKGLKASMFFTRPFEAAFKDLDNEIIEAFNLDVDDLLEFTTKK